MFFKTLPKVTTKSYQGHYWIPKWPKIGKNSITRCYFCQKGKKNPSAEGQNLPQELELGPHSGLYLLVIYITRLVFPYCLWNTGGYGRGALGIKGKPIL